MGTGREERVFMESGRDVAAYQLIFADVRADPPGTSANITIVQRTSLAT